MRNTSKALLVVVMVGLYAMFPVSSYADWNGHNSNNSGNWHGGNNGNSYGHDHGRDHSYIGINLGIWPNGYYYGAPYYPPADDVLVSPPDYEPVDVNGTTYYLNNGTYYLYTGYGYQPVSLPAVAVQQPVTVVQPATVVEPPQIISAPETTSDPGDSFTINIPNAKGGFTAVTLKKTSNGFIGPQGELYPEFPKVSQLVVIYGK